MQTTITLTRKSITVRITLQRPQYATDCFGFGYTQSRQSFWQEHGSGDLWQEVSRTEAVDVREAA